MAGTRTKAQVPAKRAGPIAESIAGANGNQVRAQIAANQGAIALIDAWLAEEPDEEDATWGEFAAALEANRRGQRPLFK